MAEVGHNSGAKELEALLSRVENLREEQKEIAAQVKEVKAEAKARGFDMKAFAAVLSLRAKPKDVREVIGIYADKLGIFG